MHKTTGEGWNQYSLFILVLSTQLCVLKITNELWYPSRLVSLVLKSLFYMKLTQIRAGTHIDLSFWCKSRCSSCTKRLAMSGTHRDLLIPSKSRCFAWKIRRWGQEPIETSYSDARYALLHAENHRWGMGPLETCNFGPKVAVLNAQNHRWGLEPI